MRIHHKAAANLIWWLEGSTDLAGRLDTAGHYRYYNIIVVIITGVDADNRVSQTPHWLYNIILYQLYHGYTVCPVRSRLFSLDKSLSSCNFRYSLECTYFSEIIRGFSVRTRLRTCRTRMFLHCTIHYAKSPDDVTRVAWKSIETNHI